MEIEDTLKIFNNATGLQILDTGGSNFLLFKPGSSLTSNRTLTVTTGDQDQTLDLTSTPFVSAANTVLARAASSSGAVSGVSLSASQLLGRGSTGDVGAITLGAGLSMTGVTLSASGAGGTVTSVDVSGGTTGLTTSGGPVTSSGTITLAGTLVVANGGTGRATLTAHTVLVGNGTSGVTQLTAGTDGQLLIGQSSADPVFTTVSGDVTITAGGVTAIGSNAVTTAKILNANVTLAKIANAAASSKLLGSGASGSGSAYSEISLGSGLSMSGTTLSASGAGGTVTSVGVSGGTTGLTTSGGPVTSSGTITLAGTLVVANGGTGRASLTNHGVLVGAGTSAVTQLSVGTDGQLLIGQSSADPAFTTVSGDVTIDATGATAIGSNKVTTTKINAAAVTLAKIANAAASSKLLGSGASGSGSSYAEITLGSGLSMSGTTLSATGTGGTVTSVDVSVNNGMTISGNPITTSGTLTFGLGNITPTSVASTGTGSFTLTNATTNAADTLLTLAHDSSGTPSAGFGSTTLWKLQSSTTADRSAADLTTTWATATDASRKARTVLNVYDTAAREVMRGEASGAAAMIGFLGASASARLASPDAGTALTTFGLASGTPTFACANLTGTLASGSFPALTGDVTTSAGSLATAIGNNKVTNAQFRQSAQLSVVGRSGTGTGNVADISANVSGSVLTYNGSTLGWRAVDLTSTDAVTGQLVAGSFPVLTGDVTTAGGALATTIGAGRVTNTMLAGSIASSKLVGTDIATVGTVTAGTWQSTKIGLAYGGTNADLSATGGASQVLKQTSSGAAITVAALASTDLPQRHNLLANSGAWFWQRQVPGTLTTISNDAYFADRWYALTQTSTIQCQRGTGNASPYSMELKQTQASAQRMGCAQIVESSDSYPFRSRTVRLQFSAKASVTTTLRYAILEWTGTADSVTSNVVNSWTSSTFTAGNFFLGSNLTVTNGTTTTSVTTSYTSCSMTGAVSSSCNNLIVFIWTDGTAAQNVTVDISDVILCDDALSRDWLPDPMSVEEDRCFRYYQKTFADGTAPAQAASGAGRIQIVTPVGSNATITFYWWQFGVAMRTAPTTTTYNPGASNAQARNETRSADCSSTTVDSATDRSCRIFAQLPISSVAGDTITLHLTVDAEL